MTRSKTNPGGKKDGPSKKAPPKDKGKGKATTSRGSKKKQGAVVIDEKMAPSRFGIELPGPEAEERWAKLCLLDHKHCRFLHMPTVRALGIADNLLALTDALGLTRLFSAGWLAYKGLTLEFLSTVEVTRQNGTPTRLTFQLGNEARELTEDQLNAIIFGPVDGSFVGCHELPTSEFWKRICLMEVEETKFYNPSKAKASSIRNPLWRYLHRLITSTFLSREHVGTCQAYDLHILTAAYSGLPQHAGCYLADHVIHQAALDGKQRIAIGAMITPIAQHFGVTITEDPISRDVHLDRAALRQQWMIAHDPSPDRWFWKIFQTNGIYLFELPTMLTDCSPGAPAANFNLSSRAHTSRMWRAGDAQPSRDGDDAEEEEEPADEEEEENDGGDDSPRGDANDGPYRMRAPDFESFEQRFYEHSDTHHYAQLDDHHNYYLQYRQFTEEQVGYVRQDVSLMREEVAGLRNEVAESRQYMGSRIDRVYEAQQAWYDEQRAYQVAQQAAQTEERANQARYYEMLEMMQRSWPYHPPQPPQDPQDPNFPPPY